VDPFQTVDPFASQSDIGTPTVLTNTDWFQSSNNGTIAHDPFVSKNEISTKKKEPAPKADPWGGSTNTNNGNSWTPFNETSPFGKTNDWPLPPPSSG
jgi:hypothetical protein